jgi:stringent starvation protein B
MTEIKTTSNKPYLVRAMADWSFDNGLTPYLYVDTKLPQVIVPEQHIGKDGSIVLNISENSCRNLSIKNDITSFSSKFNEIEFQVSFPTLAIFSIVIKETKEHLPFTKTEIKEVEESLGLNNKEDGKVSKTKEKSKNKVKKDRSHLSIVKK